MVAVAISGRAEGRYCTLAVTDALPPMTNVHVFTLLPPLEQAPDQITLRSFVALRVIDVPVVNVDEPVLPTATLMPAGLEVTRSPLRPVAVTDTVADWAGGAGGVTDSVTVRVALPAVPVSVTDVVAVTAVVAMPKFALIARRARSRSPARSPLPGCYSTGSRRRHSPSSSRGLARRALARAGR